MRITIFVIMYLISILPSILIMGLDIYDRMKHSKKQSVRVSIKLMLSCFLGSFVALFGALSNGLEYIYGSDAKLWFVIMMIVCYIILLTLLLIMHRERIIYSTASNEVLFVARFQRKIIKINEITRIYLSDEYLDVYLGDNRFRCDNIFLTGALEFEKFVKEYHKKR